MVKPLWAIAGIALLGIAGAVGALAVASSDDGEDLTPVAQLTTTPSPQGSSENSPSPSVDPKGELTVNPISGPIGTTVVLAGKGCSYTDAPTVLVFQNGDETGGAAVGAEAISYDVPTDDQGRFEIMYTIPREFESGSLQGRGGGPVTPGLYPFISKPPTCFRTFTVAQ